jgi:hypothetical protein
MLSLHHLTYGLHPYDSMLRITAFLGYVANPTEAQDSIEVGL